MVSSGSERWEMDLISRAEIRNRCGRNNREQITRAKKKISGHRPKAFLAPLGQIIDCKLLMQSSFVESDELHAFVLQRYMLTGNYGMLSHRTRVCDCHSDCHSCHSDCHSQWMKRMSAFTYIYYIINFYQNTGTIFLTFFQR